MRAYLIIILLCSSFKFYAQKSVVDSLQQIIAFGKWDRQQAKAMNTLATEYLRTDMEKAKVLLFQAISLGKNLGDERALSASYSQMVTIHQNSGKQDSAVHYLSLLKSIAHDATGPDADIIKSNHNLTAGLFYKKSGDPKQALPYFRQSVSISERTGNKIVIAGQLLNLGNTYLDLGHYKNALQYHLKALKLFEEAGNKRGESFCYQSISNSLAELKQYDNALKYAQKSIQLKTELNDKRGLGTAQDGLGNIYMGLTNYDKALQNFNASLTIAKELNLVTEQAKIYFNIGKAFAAKNNVKAAIAHFNQSKLLAKQLGDNPTSSAADIELLALQKNNSTRESEKKIFSSLKIFSESGDRIKEAAGYKNAADFYTSNELYDKALQYTTKYHRLNDSIQNTELQVQLKQMEQQFNVEKKEKEIEILKKDQQLKQQQLKQQQYFLIASMIFVGLVLCGIWLLINRNRLRQRMKELELRQSIAADLHDEVGSSLSSIHLLSQMARKEKNEKDDILTKVSINAHETMEKMSDIVWMIKPTENEGVGLKERMQRFAYDFCSSRDIDCSFNGDALNGLKLKMEQKKNLYLIFKEAVNNAVKYSDTRSLEVNIEIQHKNIVMHIKDYGKGFDEKIILKGNGLDNMHVRAKELKGNLQISSQPEQGTELSLTFPVTG